jgi:hypothetical protein
VITVLLALFISGSSPPPGDPSADAAATSTESPSRWPSIVAACLGVLLGGALALRRIRSVRE